eukprot:3118003-Amphidinium_carterae.1
MDVFLQALSSPVSKENTDSSATTRHVDTNRGDHVCTLKELHRRCLWLRSKAWNKQRTLLGASDALCPYTQAFKIHLRAKGRQHLRRRPKCPPTLLL